MHALMFIGALLVALLLAFLGVSLSLTAYLGILLVSLIIFLIIVFWPGPAGVGVAGFLLSSVGTVMLIVLMHIAILVWPGPWVIQNIKNGDLGDGVAAWFDDNVNWPGGGDAPAAQATQVPTSVPTALPTAVATASSTAAPTVRPVAPTATPLVKTDITIRQNPPTIVEGGYVCSGDLMLVQADGRRLRMYDDNARSAALVTVTGTTTLIGTQGRPDDAGSCTYGAIASDMCDAKKSDGFISCQLFVVNGNNVVSQSTR